MALICQIALISQIGLIRKDRRWKDPKNQRSKQQQLAKAQQPRFHGIPSSRKQSRPPKHAVSPSKWRQLIGVTNSPSDVKNDRTLRLGGAMIRENTRNFFAFGLSLRSGGA